MDSMKLTGTKVKVVPVKETKIKTDNLRLKQV
jgi:hypothetical protein